MSEQRACGPRLSTALRSHPLHRFYSTTMPPRSRAVLSSAYASPSQPSYLPSPRIIIAITCYLIGVLTLPLYRLYNQPAHPPQPPPLTVPVKLSTTAPLPAESSPTLADALRSSYYALAARCGLSEQHATYAAAGFVMLWVLLAVLPGAMRGWRRRRARKAFETFRREHLARIRAGGNMAMVKYSMRGAVEQLGNARADSGDEDEGMEEESQELGCGEDCTVSDGVVLGVCRGNCLLARTQKQESASVKKDSVPGTPSRARTKEHPLHVAAPKVDATRPRKTTSNSCVERSAGRGTHNNSSNSSPKHAVSGWIAWRAAKTRKLSDEEKEEANNSVSLRHKR